MNSSSGRLEAIKGPSDVMADSSAQSAANVKALEASKMIKRLSLKLIPSQYNRTSQTTYE